MSFALGAGPLCAQTGPRVPSPGIIKGELRDARGYTHSFEPDTKVVVLALPKESPPFCEIVSAAWQDTFTDIAEGRDPHGKLGGLRPLVEAREGYKADVQSDGKFHLSDMPLNRRLALAVRVQGLWRPFAEEIWLTQEKPAAERVIDFFTLGADVSKLRVAEHTVELKTAMVETLKYAAITVTETIVIENPDQKLAALPPESVKGGPFIELELLNAPGWDAALLPSLYGNQLLYCAGTPAKEPKSVPPDERANMPWLFGGVDTMHGKQTVYSDGPQISLDSWHPLNSSGELEFITEGEAFFRIKQNRNDINVAYLVFNRPIPPGENGKPGKLVIKLMHKSGVPYSAPGGTVTLTRAFGAPLDDLRVSSTGGLFVTALRTSDHSSLLADPEIGRDAIARFTPLPYKGALVEAKDSYVLSLRFDRDAQMAMANIAKSFKRPGEQPFAAPVEKSLKIGAIYGMLAALFGIGFLVTLLYTFRATREVQRLRVNQAHVSRYDVLSALAELERDYENKKLPAQSYLEHKRRLLNRAIELETKKGK